MNIIDFDKYKRSSVMKKGEILFNLNSLQNGEEISVYSKDTDILGNEKIDIYKIGRAKDGLLYIKFERNNSLDGSRNYVIIERVKTIGVSEYNKERYKKMKLNSSEINAVIGSEFEHSVIRMGYALEGVFYNGLHFNYSNIILVTRE